MVDESNTSSRFTSNRFEMGLNYAIRQIMLAIVFLDMRVSFDAREASRQMQSAKHNQNRFKDLICL
jgi:hypothetical protein